MPAPLVTTLVPQTCGVAELLSGSLLECTTLDLEASLLNANVTSTTSEQLGLLVQHGVHEQQQRQLRGQRLQGAFVLLARFRFSFSSLRRHTEKLL